jgi:hypothetical protein
MHSVVMHSVVMHSVVMHSVVMHSVVMHSVVMHSVELHSVELHNVPMHRVVLHSADKINRSGRLCTVDLLIKLACFIDKINKIFKRQNSCFKLVSARRSMVLYLPPQ